MKKHLLFKSLLLLCALIVGTSAWATTYKLTQVTSVSAGNKYVFVRNSYALSNTVSSKKLQTTGSYSTTGLSGSEAYVWALETATGGFYLKNASLKSLQYINNESGTDMSFGNTSSVWSIAFTDGKALISNTSNSNRYIGETSENSYVYKAYATGNMGYGHDFTVYILEEEVAASVSTPTFSVEAGTYTSTQSVELACATDGATIYYTLDGSTPTDGSTQYTSAISVSETKTIKAIAKKGSDYSNVASATYTIYPVLHAGTAGDPYTVADARNAIDANTGLTDVYVSGIVCEGGSELTSGAMNYWISDDGTETNKFEIYRGKGISGADFDATSDIKEGDAVVVTGTIKKFGSVYEFESGSQLVNLVPSTNPLISVTPTSLTGFTYGVGSGPSDAQTFSVEGSNLTENISLSLGESNYEMSLSEGSGYTNSLTLTQTAGSVAATTIYVRLKAGLAVNASYEGTVTLTSTGATGKAVSLAGSVTQPNFTWDLSTSSYDASPTENQVIWTSSYATMKNQKGSSSTAANNYIGGANSRTSTRFYGNQILTITPASGYAITSIVFTANSENYANALKNSTWSNATAAASTTTVTVTPTNGALPISATIGATCGFTAVKVYYGVANSVTLTPAKTYTTLTSSHNLNFTDVTGLKAFIATEISAGKVQMTQVNKVPAGTGLVLKATTPGSAVNVPVFDGTSPDDVSGNKMVGSATETTAVAENGGYILKDGYFQPATAGTLAAGKAYLNIAVGSSSARALEMNFDDNETTGLSEVTNTNLTNNTNEVFDLQGRKVAQPTKGLYIVNGKKVVIK